MSFLALTNCLTTQIGKQERRTQETENGGGGNGRVMQGAKKEFETCRTGKWKKKEFRNEENRKGKREKPQWASWVCGKLE
jgi:hypothetical protein